MICIILQNGGVRCRSIFLCALRRLVISPISLEFENGHDREKGARSCGLNLLP